MVVVVNSLVKVTTDRGKKLQKKWFYCIILLL